MTVSSQIVVNWINLLEDFYRLQTQLKLDCESHPSFSSTFTAANCPLAIDILQCFSKWPQPQIKIPISFMNRVMMKALSRVSIILRVCRSLFLLLCVNLFVLFY